MKINPVTIQALAQAATIMRYQNKIAEIKRGEEHLRMEHIHLKHLKPKNDPNKGQNVDITI